jgi:SAM-dependent MidA family methyltransferase
MSGNPWLRAHLDALIRDRGPIPFVEYMETVLYHPEHGYYSSARNPIGRQGDFYTSGNLDPAPGQLLARLFREMASRLPRFTLVEVGAGSGLLARHILEAESFPYVIVERSAQMRGRQQSLLSGFDVEWPDALPDALVGCVFSNEFFDALPVRRFVRRRGVIRELHVAEGLVEVEADPSEPVDLPLLGEGCIVDLAPEAPRWVRRIGAALERGYHLAIDYGYLREDLFRRKRGTLMCYRGHAVHENPYLDPGIQDLTAHVDFSDLIDTGRQAGLELMGFRTQKDFLVDLGLLEVMRSLAMEPHPESVRRLQALKTLILPSMMGERFRVLLQGKGAEGAGLPGFGALSTPIASLGPQAGSFAR